MTNEFLNGLVEIKVGDITEEKTDVIVNAANWTLFGGGGVDGAIHRKGGKEILRECEAIRKTLYPDGLPTGEAVKTNGGKLPAKFVIHTVGPIYGRERQNEADLLKKSYLNSLIIAAENGLKSIAFPSISTGAFYYPKHEAAAVVSSILSEFSKEKTSILKIVLVFFSQSDAETFLKHQTF